MGTNTAGKIQVYSTVPPLNPNPNKPSVEDATLSQLQDQTFTTEMKRALVPISYSADAIPNPLNTQLARIFLINMNANISSLLLADGAFDGQILLLVLKQDATGSRTLGYNASKTQGGFDVGVPVLNGTANSRDYHQLIWNATNAKWDFLPNLRRYP